MGIAALDREAKATWATEIRNTSETYFNYHGPHIEKLS